MPTAAKLISTLALALMACAVVLLLKGHLPVGQKPGPLMAVALVLAALTGWRMLGRDVGRGWMAAASAGLKATLVLCVATLFVMSFCKMIGRSLQRLYDGPLDALLGVFDLMQHFAPLLTYNDVAATLLLGGMLAGLAAEAAGRRWR